MQALQLDRASPLDALAVRDTEPGEPGAEEVLIEVHAASVSPLDVKNVQGGLPATTWPRIPGRDFAGIVLEGPPHLLARRVWGTGGCGMGITRDGSHAQLLVRPAVAVRPIPEPLTFEQAAAVGVSFSTAWLALVQAAALQHGESLLIVGAAGSVGDAAIQIARWRGAHVLGADRRQPQRLSPDEFLDTNAPDWQSRAHGVHVVFDMVAGPLFEPALASLRHGGRYVVISSPSQPRVCFNVLDMYHHELTLRGVDSLALTPHASASILDQLTPGFASGSLQPPSVRPFPLANVRAAYQAVAAGSAAEKIVLLPADS